MVQDDDSNSIHSCKTLETTYMINECCHQHCHWKGNFVFFLGNWLDNID
jgi:hypothetical protein